MSGWAGGGDEVGEGRMRVVVEGNPLTRLGCCTHLASYLPIAGCRGRELTSSSLYCSLYCSLDGRTDEVDGWVYKEWVGCFQWGRGHAQDLTALLWTKLEQV